MMGFTSSRLALALSLIYFLSHGNIAVAAASPVVRNEDHQSWQHHVEKGKFLLQTRDYKAAEVAFKSALAKVPSNDEKTIVDLLNFVGATLHSQNKDTEAEVYFKHALAKLPKKQSFVDIRRAKVLSNLSLVYSAQGRSAEAMRFCDEALSIFHKAKASSLELSVLLNTYGQLNLDAGDSRKAETLFTESVAVRQSIVGNSSLELISPLVNLSSALLDQGKWAQCETICKRAIEVCEKKDGIDSTMLYPLLSNMGRVECERHKLKDAEQALIRAMGIAEKSYGKNSQEALLTCLNLSEIYEADGERGFAEKYLVRAVEISKTTFGIQDDKTIDTMLALAVLYESHGNTSEAARLRLLCRVSKRTK